MAALSRSTTACDLNGRALYGRDRVLVIELKEGKLPEGPPEGMKIPRAELISLVTKAGLTLESEQERLLPYQGFLIFNEA
jgi:hypothetical protein